MTGYVPGQVSPFDLAVATSYVGGVSNSAVPDNLLQIFSLVLALLPCILN